MPVAEGDASSHQPRSAKSDGPSDANDSWLGRTIAGRYKVEARLGEGGMGSVYRVEHTHMRKRLALKVLHREMTSQPEIVARFEREAMAAAHIEHPNVAGATDFGKLDDGTCFLVLEYVEGTSLRTQIDEGPLPQARAVHITVQILGALKRAHELGIVHRDLKPENIQLIEKDGDPDFVKVLDFGIARVPIGSIGASHRAGDSVGPSLTRAGMVYGTPEYMAPEQALGQDVDGRSDQYAVGVMLFEMLTGKRPYDNKDKVALLGQHVAGPIPSVKARAPEGAVAPSVNDVVTKMLAKSPSDRYEDAADAAEALMIASTGGIDDLPLDLRRSDDDKVIISTRGELIDQGETMRPPSESLENGATVLPAQPKRFSSKVLATLGALFAVLLVLVVVMTTRKEPAGDTGTRDTPGPAKTTAITPTSEDVKTKVQAALGRVTAGEIETGIKDLEALWVQYPNDLAVQKALAQAYSKAKRHVDALGILKKMLGQAPELATDPALDPIINDALASPAGVDSAFAILEGPMKAEGARVLYGLGYENKPPYNLAARARKSLADPEVAKNMPAALKGAIELRNAPAACNARKEVIEKFKNDFDATALPILRSMTKTTGCGGFFKRGDCWPCMREDGFLNKVIAAVEAKK
jgi:eukaryotic-like serine/threonine-protein kinase